MTNLSPNNFTYRPLHSADASAYQRLRFEALTDTPASFLSTLETEQNRSVLSYQYELKAAYMPPVFGYHGLFVEGELIGYAQLGCSLLAKQQHLAFLYNFYVSSTRRGQGYGQKLLAYLLDLLKTRTTAEQLFVTCNAGNIPGTTFYQAAGFVNWGRKPKSVKWQGVYDDELEWVLPLREATTPQGNRV